MAIKVIRAELADDPAFIRRFEPRPSSSPASSTRTSCPLYDFWREPGGAYLVMRLLRGGSLEDR